MKDLGIRVKYLHSDIDTLERTQIIRDMRLNVFDVLVGINLFAGRAGYTGKLHWSRFWMQTKRDFCAPRYL